MKKQLMVTFAALIAAFFVGRSTQADVAAAQTTGRVLTARNGDVVRVPSAATRCVVSGEAGVPDFFCERAPRGRYHVVFFSDWIQVWRVGNPDAPVFSRRWKP